MSTAIDAFIDAFTFSILGDRTMSRILSFLVLLCVPTIAIAQNDNVTVKPNTTEGVSLAYSWAQIIFGSVGPILDDYDYRSDPASGTDPSGITVAITKMGVKWLDKAEAESKTHVLTGVQDNATLSGVVFNNYVKAHYLYQAHCASGFAAGVDRDYTADVAGVCNGQLIFASVMKDKLSDVSAPVTGMGAVTKTAKCGPSEVTATWDPVNAEWDMTGSVFTWNGVSLSEQVIDGTSWDYEYLGLEQMIYYCSHPVAANETIETSADVNSGSAISMLSRMAYLSIFGGDTGPLERHEQIQLGSSVVVEVNP